MSIRKMEALVRSVDLGSLTRAAGALGYTQSGISHLIGALEKELGTTLLIRNRGGLALTEAGERLLPYMRRITEANAAMRQEAEGLRASPAGKIRLGAFTSVAVHWLPGILKAFELTCPQVDFQLYNGDYHDMEQWIAAGQIDLGFVTLPAPPDCDAVVLAEDRLVAILPQGHPLARLSAVPVEEIAQEPFITLLQNSNQDIRRALDAAGIRPNVRFTTKDDYAIIAMVGQGLGISVVPELLLGGQQEGVAVRPLVPPAKRTIALARPHSQPASAAVDRFIACAEAWVRENVG